MDLKEHSDLNPIETTVEDIMREFGGASWKVLLNAVMWKLNGVLDMYYGDHLRFVREAMERLFYREPDTDNPKTDYQIKLETAEVLAKESAEALGYSISILKALRKEVLAKNIGDMRDAQDFLNRLDWRGLDQTPK